MATNTRPELRRKLEISGEILKNKYHFHEKFGFNSLEAMNNSVTSSKK